MRYGFLSFLASYYTGIGKEDTEFNIQKFVHELETGRVDAFLFRLQSFFADIPYEFEGTAEEALAQIDDRGYLIPYAIDGRELIKIGANFSKQTRNIDEWKRG